MAGLLTAAVVLVLLAADKALIDGADRIRSVAGRWTR